MTKLQLSIIVVWLSFTVTAFAYFINDRLVSFNFNHKLNGIELQDLANTLKPYSNTLSDSSNNTILHFSQSNCKCQQYSEDHIQDINKIATDNNFDVVNVMLTEHTVVPATPSIAILNTIGEVVYFGPYGQGLACSQTSGYAQTVINNFLQGYAANIIITEAKGCYCEV